MGNAHGLELAAPERGAGEMTGAKTFGQMIFNLGIGVMVIGIIKEDFMIAGVGAVVMAIGWFYVVLGIGEEIK